MGWKNRLTKTPYLVLFIVLISIGVGTASALITITLAGNVIITGDLDVEGEIRGSTIEELEQKFNLINKIFKGKPFEKIQQQIDDIINGNTPIAAESKVLNLGSGNPSASNPTFACLGSGSSSTLLACSINIPLNGEITDFTATSFFNGQIVGPGIGGTYTAIVVKNGIDTELSCTLSGNEAICQNTSISIQVVAGDLIELKLTKSGSTNFGNIVGSVLLKP